MMGRRGVGTRKQYPQGSALPVTDEWIAQVRAKLDENDRSDAWLASKIDVDRSMISSKLLGRPEDRPKHSKLVRPISELDIPLPSPGFPVGSAEMSLLQEILSLSPRDREAVEAMIRAYNDFNRRGAK